METNRVGTPGLLAFPNRHPRSPGEMDRLADHLLGIVNDVLDLAKLQSGKLNLEERRFNPRELAQKTIGLLHPLATGNGLDLGWD